MATTVRSRRRPSTRTTGAVGYVRVSTEEQATSGLGLAAQEQAIRAECERRGLPIVAMLRDEGLSGKSLDRPALRGALSLVESGQASVLMAAKLDRLSRSVSDSYRLMELSRREGWSLVALDLGVDTASPSGEMMAGVASVFAQFERRVISQRTKDALAAKKAQGVKLGRPISVAPRTRRRIVTLRNRSLTWRAIATALTDEGHATGYGGRWHGSTVRRMYDAEMAGKETAS